MPNVIRYLARPRRYADNGCDTADQEVAVVGGLKMIAVIVGGFIVLSTLLIMLPLVLIGLAASGATLSNPADSMRVGGIFAGYITIDLLSLAAIGFLPTRRWPWALAAFVAVLPLGTFLLAR